MTMLLIDFIGCCRSKIKAELTMDNENNNDDISYYVTIRDVSIKVKFNTVN